MMGIGFWKGEEVFAHGVALVVFEDAARGLEG
jgi:hypothetical protein